MTRARLMRLASSASMLARDRRGVSAVEFALVAPVFLLILAGIVDVSRMIGTRAGLDASVAAAANYVLLNGSAMNASSAEGLAKSAATVAAGSGGAGSARVTVNGGFTVSISGGMTTKSGDIAVAGKCFCPSSTGGGMSWESPVQCEAPCPDGSHAGKFVEIRASLPYEAMFIGYGITNGADAIEVMTVVNP